jgi:predicted dehydrogenase
VNVAIIGCGLIGHKRAEALRGCRLVACADIVGDRAATLAEKLPPAQAMNDWRAAVERPDVEVVIVATTHDVLAEITLAALSAGKHVLVEKPAARNAAELDPVIEAATRGRTLVRVGFNHRYHPALRKARELVDNGALGELIYVRGRYGHGGRLGYEREWRADPDRAGGGELIDQGVHLIDLARWFLGDFVDVQGVAHTYYWDTPMEDNGFMLLQTAKRQVAFLHASWTEWKNLFSLELFGRLGKLDITGLGGSYGVERLVHYRMLPHMGPPDATVWEFPNSDTSWEVEFDEFLQDIRFGRQPAAGLCDAQGALQVVERIYKASGR